MLGALFFVFLFFFGSKTLVGSHGVQFSAIEANYTCPFLFTNINPRCIQLSSPYQKKKNRHEWGSAPKKQTLAIDAEKEKAAAMLVPLPRKTEDVE